MAPISYMSKVQTILFQNLRWEMNPVFSTWSISTIALILIKRIGSNFTHGFVLSALIYRFNRNRGATVKWLAVFLGFDKRTVAKSLALLHRRGLIAPLHGKQWLAEKPTGKSVYGWKRNSHAKDWWKQIKTFRFHGLAGRTLSLKQASVFWLLRHLQNRAKKPITQTQKGVADMLGIGRDTANTAFRELAELGLMTLMPLPKIVDHSVVTYQQQDKDGQVIERTWIDRYRIDTHPAAQSSEQVVLAYRHPAQNSPTFRQLESDGIPYHHCLRAVGLVDQGKISRQEFVNNYHALPKWKLDTWSTTVTRRY